MRARIASLYSNKLKEAVKQDIKNLKKRGESFKFYDKEFHEPDLKEALLGFPK